MEVVRHIPNALTLLRFLLIPVQLVLLAQRRYDVAFAVFAMSALSDFVDGIVARRWNARTRFGAIADPIADKSTVVTMTILLAMQDLLPLWLVTALIVRDAVIVAGALAYHFAIGAYEIEPTLLSKLHTGVVFIALAAVLGGAAGFLYADGALQALFALLLGTTVASGVQYVWVWGRRAIRSARRDRSTGG